MSDRSRHNGEREEAEMIFTAGLPAAGKSTAAELAYPDARHIDADEFKHPDKDPAEVHAESKEAAKELFKMALDFGAGRWVYHKTCGSVDSMIGRIEAARRAGFTVKLIFVRCDLNTSLERNRKRDRTVPEHIVREKAETVADAVKELRWEVDEYEEIDNDGSLEELKRKLAA